MSDIDALRERVEAAERSFGLIDERERTYSARLITLIASIEEQLGHHQAEIAEREARESALDHENRELRAMLHTLLLAVEDGSRDQLGGAINDMDQRVAALLANPTTPRPATESSETPADPAKDSADTTDASEAAEPGGDDALVSDTDDTETGDAETGETVSDSPSDDMEESAEAEDSAVEAAEESVVEEITPEPDEASLDDALIEAVAEAIDDQSSDAADETAEPVAQENEVPDALDQDDVLAELGLSDLGPSEPDDITGDQAAAAAADETCDGSTGGTDVVMTDEAVPEGSGAEPVASQSDPELAERAEKIAQLLGSGDDSDPTVKEIIEKVTELAETIAPTAKPDAAEDIDLSVESIGESAGDLDDSGIDVIEAEALAEVTAA